MCSTGLIFKLRILGLRVEWSNPTVTSQEVVICPGSVAARGVRSLLTYLLHGHGR